MAEPAASALSILLAEDNKINQKFAGALLAKAGHRVTIAENGHQAVDAVRRGDFDVILMDIQMPDLDGIGATREIRALPAPKNKIPIIALTAHAMSGARAEYLAAGMDDYVTKPVQAELLLGKLAAIGGRRTQTEPGVELPASIPLDSLPVLDVDKLNALTESLSLEAVRGFLQLFLADTLSHIAAITTEDRQSVMRNAHAVVSAAGNIGVMRLSAVAKLVEAACRENNVLEIPRLTGELQALARVSEEEIHAWLLSHQTPARAQA